MSLYLDPRLWPLKVTIYPLNSDRSNQVNPDIGSEIFGGFCVKIAGW